MVKRQKYENGQNTKKLTFKKLKVENSQIAKNMKTVNMQKCSTRQKKCENSQNVKTVKTQKCENDQYPKT